MNEYITIQNAEILIGKLKTVECPMVRARICQTIKFLLEDLIAPLEASSEKQNSLSDPGQDLSISDIITSLFVVSNVDADGHGLAKHLDQLQMNLQKLKTNSDFFAATI